MISIILTTLQSARHVRRALASCLAQTDVELEVIVVDGGSTDGTLGIVASFADPRIRVVQQVGNAGKLPGAINLGMAAARGAFLTWGQDDAWFEPHAMATMRRFLVARPDVSLVYADYWDVDAAGTRIAYQRVNDPEPATMLVDDVCRQTFLMRRAVYETVGPQDTRHFPVHEPIWRWRVAQQFTLAPLHIPLMSYTVHPDSLTGRIGGWNLMRMMARAFAEEGVYDPPALRRQLARIDVDEAFEAFVLHGDYPAFYRRAFSGIAGDPSHVWNRGLAKLLVAGLTPARGRYRAKLLQAWQRRHDAEQQRAVEGAQPSSMPPIHQHP